MQLIDLSDLTLAARTFLFATRHHDVTLRYKHWLAVLTEAVLQRLGPEYELVKEEKLVGVSSDPNSCPRSRTARLTLFPLRQLYTVLFARKSVSRRFKDLESSGIKTGFSAEYGNKVRRPTPRLIPTAMLSSCIVFRLRRARCYSDS